MSKTNRPMDFSLHSFTPEEYEVYSDFLMHIRRAGSKIEELIALRHERHDKGASLRALALAKTKLQEAQHWMWHGLEYTDNLWTSLTKPDSKPPEDEA